MTKFGDVPQYKPMRAENLKAVYQLASRPAHWQQTLVTVCVESAYLTKPFESRPGKSL